MMISIVWIFGFGFSQIMNRWWLMAVGLSSNSSPVEGSFIKGYLWWVPLTVSSVIDPFDYTRSCRNKTHFNSLNVRILELCLCIDSIDCRRLMFWFLSIVATITITIIRTDCSHWKVQNVTGKSFILWIYRCNLLSTEKHNHNYVVTAWCDRR